MPPQQGAQRFALWWASMLAGNRSTGVHPTLACRPASTRSNASVMTCLSCSSASTCVACPVQGGALTSDQATDDELLCWQHRRESGATSTPTACTALTLLASPSARSVFTSSSSCRLTSSLVRWEVSTTGPRLGDPAQPPPLALAPPAQRALGEETHSCCCRLPAGLSEAPGEPLRPGLPRSASFAGTTDPSPCAWLGGCAALAECLAGMPGEPGCSASAAGAVGIAGGGSRLSGMPAAPAAPPPSADGGDSDTPPAAWRTAALAGPSGPSWASAAGAATCAGASAPSSTSSAAGDSQDSSSTGCRVRLAFAHGSPPRPAQAGRAAVSFSVMDLHGVESCPKLATR